MKKLKMLMVLIIAPCFITVAAGETLQYGFASGSWHDTGSYGNITPYTASVRPWVDGDLSTLSAEWKTGEATAPAYPDSSVIKTNRDYTWYGPTTDDEVKWNAGLGGWEIPVGNHAVYPTVKLTNNARSRETWYTFGGGELDTPPELMQYRNYYCVDVDDYEWGLWAGRDTTEKFLPKGGGTIASAVEEGSAIIRYKDCAAKWSWPVAGDWPSDAPSWMASKYPEGWKDAGRLACEYYGVQKYVVTVTGSGGGGGGGAGGDASANVNFDMDRLREILIEVFKDYGKYVGGGSGGGGGGGGSIIIGGGGDGEGGGGIGSIDVSVNGGNISVSGNVGVSGTIKIDSLKADVSAAVTEALNSGRLKIDWSLFQQAFPNGLDVDWSKFSKYTSQPTVNIVRSVSADTPVKAETGVRLTIEAKDTNLTPGEGNMTVIVDGVKHEGSGATVSFTTDPITTNRTVTIVAIDGNGNSKNYDVEITNIDTEAPKIESLEASRETWTKDPVDVVVKATDDQKLADQAYRWYYQSTTDQGDGDPRKPDTPATDWTNQTSFKAPDSGNVWVEVRDATGQITLSAPCYVRCIDKIPPKVVGHQLDPPDGEMSSPQKGTTVTIDIENVGDPSSKDASPLASLMVQWKVVTGTEEKEMPWRSSQSIVVNKNCTIYVRVRDSLGNTSDYGDYEPIVVSNVADADPDIVGASSTATAGEWVRPPVVLSIYAEKGKDGTAADLADRAFSWDGGHTWLLPNDKNGDTWRSDFTVYHNGQYTVMVRDILGTITEQTFIVSNIDETPPEAEIYTYKDLPDDWDVTRDGDGTPSDYVWRLRVTAADRESGLDHVELHFGGENASISPDALPFHMELEEPGIYAVTAYDRAGNSTYAEKSITYEALGEAGGAGSHAYVDIKKPVDGTAGAAFNGADLGDLVYSTNGVYNMKTNVYTDYSGTVSGYDGIEAHFTVTASSSHFITGYATFGSGRYPVYVNGNINGERGFRDMPCVVKIPKSALVQDVKNGKLIIVMQEYSTDPGGNENPAHAKLLKEGTATLYTNVQVNPPRINYTYNRSTNEMTIVATSAVAGIKAGYPTYSYGGGETQYVGPFQVDQTAATITLKAVDNCGLSTELPLDISTLSVTGEGGGTLPTQNAGSGTNSYYVSGRSAEIYIIGGTKQNTNVIPSSTVVNSVLGTP